MLNDSLSVVLTPNYMAEDIGHSLLLKYFVNTSIMSESKSEIESNVPETQSLRGDLNAIERGEIEHSVFSPVLTVTKEETTLTKEDRKVQKVVTTEDVSDISIVVKEVEIQGKDTNSKVFVSVTKEEAIYTSGGGKDDKDDVNNNPKQTRIPKLNFKQAADKIRREEQITNEKSVQEPILGIKVRSSIPRLKEAKLLAQKSHSNGEKREDTKKLDDEFDKIYEEIKDNNIEVNIQTPESLRDAEIVDSIFEEIIHAYDDNDETLKQEGNTEKVKSKIPLLKRKSEQEIVVPNNRRGSLKKRNSVDESRIPVHNKSLTVKDLEAKSKNSKISGSYSFNKSESVNEKKIDSFQSTSLVKTVQSQRSIETKHTNVSSEEAFTVKSSEISKQKIPVKSQMKDIVETKLSSGTLNRPVRTNVVEKITNQKVDVDISNSSISQSDLKVEKSNNLTQSVTRQISSDYQSTNILNNNEENLTNDAIIKTNQEIKSSATTESLITSNTRTTSNETKNIIQTTQTSETFSTEKSFSVNSSESNIIQTKNMSNLDVNYINKDSDFNQNIIIEKITNEEANVNDTTNIQLINKIIDNSNVTFDFNTSNDLKSESSNKTVLVNENQPKKDNFELNPKESKNISTNYENGSNIINSKEINKEEIKEGENNKEINVKLREIDIGSNIMNENQNKITNNINESEYNIQASVKSVEIINNSIHNVNKHDSYLTNFEHRDESIVLKTKKGEDNAVKINENEKLIEHRDESIDKGINNNKIILEITKNSEENAVEINKTDNLPINNLKIETKEINITTEAKGEESDISIKEYNVTRDFATKINSDSEIKSEKVEIGQEKSKLITTQIKNMDDLDEEDIIVLKGKVNRIISRLDSRETKIEKMEDDIPKNVSVISKVAIFEKNEPENHKNEINDENSQHDKPVIVDEILKHNQNRNNKENIILNIYDKKENAFDYDSVFNKVHSSVLRRLKSIETKRNINLNEKYTHEIEINETEIQINKPEIEKMIINEETNTFNESETAKVKSNNDKSLNNYNRTKSLAELHFNDTMNVNDNVFDAKFRQFNEERRAKSLAELDLGDIMKGRVRQMVMRMNSIEKESQERRVFERSRSRGTVLSRAAVFEKKVVPIRAEENITKEEKPSVSPSLSEEELSERIEELRAAKSKYGKWVDMPSIELRDGSSMPVIALGTALLEPKLIKHIVCAAIDLGYRAFDTAFIYGNEKEVGEAIRSKIEDGTVKREELFIISKLWSTFHRRDLVEEACRSSLQSMGLGYFDLFMIHNPMSFREGPNPIPKIANVLQYSQHDYLEAWYGMESVVTKGLARRIGVSNFNSAQVDRIMDKAKIKPVVNQVECHPYLAQHNLDDFCSHRNVKLSCFSVLGSKGTPQELKSGNCSVIDDPLILVMAAGLGVTPAQLLIAYQVFHNRNVVVKSSTGAHLWDNLLALNLKLDKAQVSALDALNKNKRTFTFKGMGDTHKNYPFKTAF